jgi:2,5-dihydroxypyridine 5,6-dioxygenase
MLTDRIEAKWIDAFAHTFHMCEVKRGEMVAVLSETQSRPLNVHLAELALARHGAKAFHVVVPTPAQTAPVPVRSTGASSAVGGAEPVIKALAACDMIVDLTVEGMLHAPELPAILKDGARLLFVSNEHPDVLERLLPDAAIKERVDCGLAMLKSAEEMHVTSDTGTDLRVRVAGAWAGGMKGYVTGKRAVDHWPGGLIACFPQAGAANGRIVLAPGDMNLTFKRHLETPVTLTVQNDYVRAVDGDGADAELMRSYFEAWGDRNAYAVSHVGWGMNQRARWDAIAMYDKRDINGTEQRVFAGNFLYSTGANERAKRFTLGHFDLPLRNCTVQLDGKTVVERGKLAPELA